MKSKIQIPNYSPQDVLNSLAHAIRNNCNTEEPEILNSMARLADSYMTNRINNRKLKPEIDVKISEARVNNITAATGEQQLKDHIDANKRTVRKKNSRKTKA